MSWTPGTPVHLETERFVLRSVTQADVTEVYLGWTGDAEIARNFNRLPERLSAEKLSAYVRRFDNQHSFQLMVLTRETGTQIGLHTVYCDAPNASAKLHVLMGDRAYWGKGVVTETRAAMFDFLFEEVGLEKVWGTPFGRNFAAIFNYQAQGFRCEGILRAHLKSVDGDGRLDQYFFGLLRDEWRARRGSDGGA